MQGIWDEGRGVKGEGEGRWVMGEGCTRVRRVTSATLMRRRSGTGSASADAVALRGAAVLPRRIPKRREVTAETRPRNAGSAAGSAFTWAGSPSGSVVRVKVTVRGWGWGWGWG